MAIERGQPAADVPSAVSRSARRVLRQVDAADDLAFLGDLPDFASAILVNGGTCSVPVAQGWTLDFEWRADHAWYVRLVGA